MTSARLPSRGRWRGRRLATILACAVVLGGCLRRTDFVAPPPPAPSVRTVEALPAPPAGPLTAADAVRLALARNPDVRAAAARILDAEAHLAAANAAYLPRLGAEVSYVGGNWPSVYLFKTIDARRLPPNTDFNDPPDFSSLGGQLALRLNVWNGGRDQLGAWAAATGAEATVAERDAVRNGLVAIVVGAWFDARAAAAARIADEATVRTLEEQVAATRVRVDGGAALRTDLLSLEVRLAEVRTEWLHDDVSERLALAMLRELLALPADASVTVAGSGPLIDPLPSDGAAALAQAYASRAEAAAARRAVEQAGLELAAARRAWLPRLDLESRLGTELADAHRVPSDPNWTVGVALSTELFDGGTRRANVSRALAALDRVSQADRGVLLRIAREVESSYLRLDEARARLVVVTRALAMAQETLTLVGTQYRGGAVTVTRFLEAEAALAHARAAHIQGTLDVGRAEVETARAIGALGNGPMTGGPS